MPSPAPPARHFRTRAALRAWYERHHATTTELWVAYYKKGVDAVGVGYAEAVEEAICFGWIDGRLTSIDARSYANRYTPRRPGSHWTEGNLSLYRRLRRAGRVRAAGRLAFAQRAR